MRSNVDAVVHAAADRAAERAAEEWRARPAGRALLAGGAGSTPRRPRCRSRTRAEVRAWQGDVFELVRSEAGGRRTTARFASLGVNGAGLVVMLAVFAQTGGLTGAEVAVAGGTTAAGQRILEALLGDQAVRTLAARAREMLLERARARCSPVRRSASRPCSPRSRRSPTPRSGCARPCGASSRRDEPRARSAPERARRGRAARRGAAGRRGGRARPAPWSRAPVSALGHWAGRDRRRARRSDRRRQVHAVQRAGRAASSRAPACAARPRRRRPRRSRPESITRCWTGSTSAHGTRSTPVRPRAWCCSTCRTSTRSRRAHRAEVDRLVRVVDLLVWVVDPQKYADASLHEGYLRPLAGHAAAMLVVLNQVDLLAGQGDRAREDLRRVLGGYGLGDVPVLARVRSDRRGHASSCAPRSRSASAAGRPRWHAWRPTSEAVVRATPRGRGRRARRRHRPARARAARRRARGRRRAPGRGARRRTRPPAPRRARGGVPWTAWLRRLRPDPLRRLGIGREPQEQARTSLPPASPVQRAQVDSALRTIAVQAATGLPDPWPALARRAATANESELADRLDQAVAGADLRMAAAPRWWHAARWLQRGFAVVTARRRPVARRARGPGLPAARRRRPDAGRTWHARAHGAARRRRCSWPSSSRRSRASPTAGARAAVRRRARRALDERIEHVADELVIAPLERELATHSELLQALAGEQRRGRLRRSAPQPVPS